MLLLAAAALAAAPPPKITVLPNIIQPPHSTATCPRVEAYVAGAESRYDGPPLSPRKLTELPPGRMYVAVMRQDENGCLAPIVIKYGLGR